MSVAYLIIYSFTAAKTGANLTRWDKASFQDAVKLSMAWLITTSAVLVIHFALELTSELKRMLILMSSVFFLAGILLVRFRSRVLTGLTKRIMLHRTNSKVTAKRVLIVGSGRTAEQILWMLGHPAYSGKYHIVGITDDDLFSQGMNIYGTKVVGETKDVARIVTEMDAGLVILADHRMSASSYGLFHEMTRNTAAKVVVAPDIFGSLETLDTFKPGEIVNDGIDNFQCSHCLARKCGQEESKNCKE